MHVLRELESPHKIIISQFINIILFYHLHACVPSTHGLYLHREFNSGGEESQAQRERFLLFEKATKSGTTWLIKRQEPLGMGALTEFFMDATNIEDNGWCRSLASPPQRMCSGASS